MRFGLLHYLLNAGQKTFPGRPSSPDGTRSLPLMGRVLVGGANNIAVAHERNYLAQQRHIQLVP